MTYASILARLRKEKKITQIEAAAYISKHSVRLCNYKMVSSWETEAGVPSIEHFLLLCELYEVADIQDTFRGQPKDYRGITKLNGLGKSRAEEYIALLLTNPRFAETEKEEPKPLRVLKFYDIPPAAGMGQFLDSDAYEEFEADATVPVEADFALRVSGDSMMPRFIDRQIVFVKEQSWLDADEIGIFALNGNSYIKKLGTNELLSLNPQYAPIPIRDHDTFHIFGKVVG